MLLIRTCSENESLSSSNRCLLLEVPPMVAGRQYIFSWQAETIKASKEGTCDHGSLMTLANKHSRSSNLAPNLVGETSHAVPNRRGCMCSDCKAQAQNSDRQRQEDHLGLSQSSRLSCRPLHTTHCLQRTFNHEPFSVLLCGPGPLRLPDRISAGCCHVAPQ